MTWSNKSNDLQNGDGHPARLYGTYLIAGFIAFILAIILLAFSAFNTLSTDRERRETIALRALELTEISLSFDHAIGYGGFIHHFKTAVLRVEERDKYVNLADSSLAEIVTNMSSLLALAPELAQSTVDVRRTLEEYSLGLEFMRQNPNLSAVETDKVVRVDDTAAISGLALLIEQLVIEEKEALQNLGNIPRETTIELTLIVGFFFATMLLMLVLFIRFRATIAQYETRVQNAREVAAIADSALIAIALIDDDGKLVYRNSAARRILPELFETLDAVPISLLNNHTDTDILAKAFRGDWQRSVIYEYSSAGTIKYLSIESGERLTYGTQAVHKIAIRDITDVAIADQINARNQGLSTLGNVAGGIAHDFRNAVGAAKISIDSALRKETLSEAQPMLENARAALQVGKDLAKRLLDFADQRKSGGEQTDLNDCIRLSVMMANLQLHDPSILKCDFSPKSPIVSANKNFLANAIFNLILNAHEALLAENVASPEIKIWLEETETYFGQPAWAICCQDNGPGFSEEALANWRDMFFTTKPHGTGVGLTIVKSLVDESAGFMTVENKPEGGALITVVLAQPVEPITTDDMTQPEVDIVVVEDDVLLFNTLIQGVMNSGHSVKGFETADDAIEYMENHAYKLLLTDLDVPGTLKGNDLVRWSKLNHPDRCVIVHSRIDSGNIPYIKQLGATFIPKGTTRLELETAIAECLS